ncbi:hypothetical protein WJ63_03450 [Burkholderia pyrrocinia]|nr:hypothetical protein WJ63_03450 [Burkholderia pyrrocinia]
MADELEFEANGIFCAPGCPAFVSVLCEICATQVGESSIRQRVVDPALDAPIFLIGVALFWDDLATVPLQCLTERSALGFGAIDVCAAIHLGLHASSPLLGLLLGVE